MRGGSDTGLARERKQPWGGLAVGATSLLPTHSGLTHLLDPFSQLACEEDLLRSFFTSAQLTLFLTRGNVCGVAGIAFILVRSARGTGLIFFSPSAPPLQ